jgi:hypothetical protein
MLVAVGGGVVVVENSELESSSDEWLRVPVRHRLVLVQPPSVEVTERVNPRDRSKVKRGKVQESN